MDRTASFYSRPSYVGGAGSIYAGSRRQRGGSVLGALKSVVSPLLSGVGSSLKKNVMNNAFGLAADVVGDVLGGKNVKQSFLNRGKQRGLSALKQTFTDVTGMGRKRVGRRKKVKRVGRRRQRGSGKRRVKRRRRAPSKKPSRKRKGSRKRAPSAKRRRVNF